jgi:uncharacterized coiled-coil protein SlyX
MNLFAMSTDSVQFAIIAALISALGGVIIYIQSQGEKHQQEHNARTEAKLGSLDEKMEQSHKATAEAQKANAEDHANVVSTLSRVEQAILGVNKDLERHEREIDYLNRQVDDLRERTL